jgi:peptidoglycan/xylan/chitin deacetylase (PgdA/CDA1 family)
VDDWLEPLRSALDEAPAPVDVFFRDDDAGWDDGRLLALMDVLERHRLPLDLAVIPRELRAALADSLAARVAESGGRVGLHQHGLAHANREASGRKSEFGHERAREDQRRDIVEGRAILEETLPGLAQPVFTPPWNRCTRTTAELLAELGFLVLSRHDSEPSLDVEGLVEVPVSVDWTFAKRDGARLTFGELGALAGARAQRGGPVGINLHHAAMDRDELGLLDRLCALVANHRSARPLPLLAVADEAWAGP